jgi:CRISPR-associated endonuclease Cas1
MIWFAETRRRVEVRFDDALVARTLELRDVARGIATDGRLPPPLRDSPKCEGCSLVGICLPDEHYALQADGGPVRPLFPARDDGVPLYARLQGGSLSKDGEEIVVRDRGKEVGRARIAETSRVAVLGNVTVTTPLLRELASRDIPVAFHGHSGWFYGSFTPSSGRNVMTRIAQHRAAADPARALSVARSFVHAKILNSLVLLRRNGEGVPENTLLRLQELAADAARAENLESLLGIEGVSARFYFEQFPRMLKSGLREAFAMDGRNRRPPRDPVNALLSFAYACLVRELTVIVGQIGFDPYVGYLHQPRYGRPALPLDLMEEFRPIVADSVVISAINNEVIQVDDFIVRPTGVSLGDAARTRFVGVYERRMDELATHPTFGTRLSYRRILEVQARLLGKVLLGELAEYPEYRVR